MCALPPSGNLHEQTDPPFPVVPPPASVQDCHCHLPTSLSLHQLVALLM